MTPANSPHIFSRSIGSAVRLGALNTPSKPAIRMLDGDGLTYAQLNENTDRLANAMIGSGARIGDRIGIWMDNDVRYLEIYLACVKAGLVVVQLNVRHTSHEAQYQLENAGVVGLFFDDSSAGRVDALPGSDAFRFTVTTGADRVAGATSYPAFREYGHAGAPDHEPAPGDLAVLAYTSGTTGFPKGARLTHRSLRAIGQTNALANRYALGSTQLFALSLSFSAGIPAHVLPHLMVGGTTILMPGFDTPRLVDAIDREHATFTILPSPPIVEFCQAVSERPGPRLPSLVSLLHGTAKAPEEHLELLVDTIGPRLVEGWGMTENSGGLLAATTAQDYVERRPGIFGSTGRPVPDTIVRLLDGGGEEVPHDGSTVGQLVVRSRALADGYWNNDEATARSFQDGWYHTGDLGTVDPEGYIQILDRRTDLIISGGMNVYPSELERVILQMGGVRECAIIGVPHERWGQTPVAYVVCALAGQVPTEAEIAGYCREHLAGYKQPSQVMIVDSLPRNASGKVMRHRLGAPAI